MGSTASKPEEAGEDHVNEEEYEKLKSALKEHHEERNLYSVLNVPRNANQTEINAAYRKMSRIFHPDKGGSEKQFQLIVLAKETLLDPIRRNTYDLYGMAGLELLDARKDDLAVSQKLQTPKAVEMWVEKLLRRTKQEESLMKAGKTQLRIPLQIQDIFPLAFVSDEELLESFQDAEGMMVTMDEEERMEVIQHLREELGSYVTFPALNNASLKHKLPISDQFKVQAGLYSNEETGSLCHLGIGWESPLSEKTKAKFVAESNGLAAKFQCKVKGNIGVGQVVSLSSALQTAGPWENIVNPRASLPIQAGYSYSFNQNWSGEILYGFDAASQLMLQLPDTGRVFHFNQAELTLGAVYAAQESGARISASMMQPFRAVNLNFRWARRVGKKSKLIFNGMARPSFEEMFPSKWHADLGFSHQLAYHTDFSLGVRFGSEDLSLTLGVEKNNQSLVLPISIVNNPSWQEIALALIIPTVFLTATQLLILGPANRRYKRKKIEERRIVNREWVQSKRAEVEAELSMLKRSADRNKKTENSRNGLIIVDAVYGKLDEEKTDYGDPLSCIVTDALQFQVKDSQLKLASTPKAALSGFYDPCPGEEKRLRITYLYRGKPHQAEYSDLESVVLPIKSHRVKTEEFNLFLNQ